MLLPFVAGGEHDEVRCKRLAVLQPRALSDELRDVGKLPQRDLALHDEIGAADVEVITAAARQVFELPAGSVLPEIEPESDAGQLIEQLLIQFLRVLGEEPMGLPRQWERHRRGNEIAVLKRRSFVV